MTEHEHEHEHDHDHDYVYVHARSTTGPGSDFSALYAAYGLLDLSDAD